VVPVYNRPLTVLEALDSIARQTAPPRRVVVVDDGSTDDTAERVREWSHKHRLPLKLVRQANWGAALARDRAVAETGDCSLLAFLDSDDLWPPDYLERMTQAMAEQPDAVAASSDCLFEDARTGRSRLARLNRLSRQATVSLVCGGPAGTPNTVVRRRAYQEIGGFAPLACLEDYDLMLRLSLRGPWLHVPGTPVQARRNIYLCAGGDPPLSKRFEDRAWRLARMLEDFLLRKGGAEVVPARLWRPRLGQAWYHAGRDFVNLGDAERARHCFDKAVALSPFHIRAHFQRWLLRWRPRLAYRQ
jgi:glycosyltransferase involved in cell wall biosynthesis